MGRNISRIAEIPIVRRLLSSENPIAVYTVRAGVLDEPVDSPEMAALRERIRSSDIARRLLSHRQTDGTVLTYPERGQTNPYQKWQGPHWTLACLAEIGYPSGDGSLIPMRDQFYGWLFSDRHLKPPRTLVIPGQENRIRRCASQEANALWYSLVLGIADERTEILAERLKQWQWPDGGWNCDKRPEAGKSSFVESIVPLRALALHGRLKRDRKSLAAAERAAEVFLKRRLYRTVHDGSVMNPTFLLIQYPYLCHYSILFGLKVIVEAGFIRDKRCEEALDILESKRLPDGGFPLEKRRYRISSHFCTNGTFADWGPPGKRRSNELITADALTVLRAAGRL